MADPRSSDPVTLEPLKPAPSEQWLLVEPELRQYMNWDLHGYYPEVDESGRFQFSHRGCTIFVDKVSGTFRILGQEQPRSVSELISKLKEIDEQADLKGWGGPPMPLPNTHPGVPTLPLEMIPEPFREYVRHGAQRVGVNPEMIAVPLLVVLSSLVARILAMKPELHDDFTVIPNLWGAIVDRPSRFKTYCIKEATDLLRPLIVKAEDDYRTRSARIKANRRALTDDIQAETRKRTGRDINKIAEMERQLADLDEQDSPRRYQTSDPTTAALGEVMRRNPGGILLCRDEIAGWLRSLDRFGSEGDREFFLESWNGDGRYTLDRIKRGHLEIPALRLSIVGTIQPGKLEKYVADAINGGINDDGLLQRFQLLVWPDQDLPWKRPTTVRESAAKEEAIEAVAAIDNFDPTKHIPGLASGSTNQIPSLRWSPLAQELWNEWRDRLEDRLRGDGLIGYPAFEAHLGKYRSLMPSLALVFEFCRWADHQPDAFAGGVSLQSARLAAAWADFLEEHARKVYAAELQPGLAAAQRLAEKIMDGSVGDFDKLRDIKRAQWSGLQDSRLVDAAVDYLARANWIQIIRSGSKSGLGRDAAVICIHPHILKRRNEGERL